MKWSIRLRFTLLYSGIFFVTGLLLVGISYVIVVGILDDTRVRLQAAPEFVPNHAILEPSGRVVMVTVSRRDVLNAQQNYEQATMNRFLLQTGLVVTLLGTLATTAGWVMSGRVLKPLYQVTDTARRVAHGHNLNERISYTGSHHDVKDLADTFDMMLARLAHAFDVQKRFVANASHELRTPLTINRTLVEVALRRPDATPDAQRLGESLLVVNTRHERLIDGLLALAESDRPVLERRQSVDLAEVASHVVDQAGEESDAGAIVVHRTLASAPTTGDPILLERLVQNLVENAIRHNLQGGEVWVTTRVSDGEAELSVANTGPTVPAYDLEAIFEPFRRLRTDRVRSDRGTGLGLSIVRATAQAHQGTVVADPREEGGLTMTVRLPSS
ncbi:cell wall metabolism sensor histidine kinase WalK [Nonomuraea sp. C10]|uniref:sensor histidine kinase n=1 Tax=Nonomuraea sp. C10 TaxID=2600577 RepID=UPI0011CD8E09|nr:HAMP domain-containing sensor histidine kinase [Nonomuraea sp. C10]TXK34855.1 HAMP domain-containing histidine kinase [Nonomuraea sp. C10]